MKCTEGEAVDPIFEELDALIAAGWGDVPGNLIPADWRTTTPPLAFRVDTLPHQTEELDPAVQSILDPIVAKRDATAYYRRPRSTRSATFFHLERKCSEMRDRMQARRKKTA